MNSFHQLDLPEILLCRLKSINYLTPTPIQAKTIPLTLQGKDIFGSAQTGTGKTGAFIIPILSTIIANKETSALVLSPTRELASQIMDFTKKLIDRKTYINTALLIGGQPINKQLFQLKRRPQIIIGTPGRVNDHINRKTLKLNNLNYLILDEADRMLDMGFSDQLENIVERTPQSRQTLMFSATIPNDIIGLAHKYLKSPERVAIGTAQTPAVKIKREVLFVDKNDKYVLLTSELDKRKGSIIIFVKTKHNTENLSHKLSENFNVQYLHGDLRQTKRDRIIKNFRNKKFRILIATDVAARGLDIPHIEHVINYDLPQCPEDYIHRIGRTARANSKGAALCIVSPEDKPKWKAIEYFIETGKKQPIKKQKPTKRKYFGFRSSSNRSKYNSKNTKSNNPNFKKPKKDAQ